jgi:arylsulfatase A-like enzyme
MHKAPHRPWEPDAKHAHMYEDVDIPEPATFNDDYATRSEAARQQKMSMSDLTPTDTKGPPPEGLTPEQLKHWKYERFIKDYLRCVAGVDDSVGRLLEYLDKKGLADNTVVIYTSDQGFYLGDHGWFDKRWMYEESLRMPLIVRYPGHIKAGSVCDGFVQNIDFAPTMLDYAGAVTPELMQGASVRGVLDGKGGPPRTSVYYHYWEEGTEHHVAAHYGVRTEGYKLIRFYAQVKAWELYDLREDPHELRNVYEDPKYAPVVAELTAQLEKLRAQYGDTGEGVGGPTKAPKGKP